MIPPRLHARLDALSAAALILLPRALRWPDRLAQGVDVLRIRRGVYPDGLDAVVEAGLRTDDPLVEGQSLLTMGPLKIISDGSLNTRTAWCEHAYADGSGHGAANQTPAELRALMSRATEHGLRTAVHAIGDAACHDAVAAYAETGARGLRDGQEVFTAWPAVGRPRGCSITISN